MLSNRNLEAIAPVLATFRIEESGGVDDLKDANIGEPVTLSGCSEVGRIGNGDQLLGKLIALTLTDNDDSERLATVQVGGICRLAISTTYPLVGNRVVGGSTPGTVQQSSALYSIAGVSIIPEGGHIARGTVIEVNGTTDCLVLLN